MSEKTVRDTATADDGRVYETPPDAAYAAFWEGAHLLPDAIKRKLSAHELRQIAREVVPRVYWLDRSSSTQ